ncbi:hypothetical protein [[Kitasatospora] papulosa]|uniref:hypothetical protein n=1 Tax=[Kitasatospora] papulosa TaxID=1464011 RepID=UPI003682E72E
MPDEIRPGRRSRYRFTQTPQWVLLWTDVTDAGYRAYSLLLAHVNAERGDGLVWPTQAALAAMLEKHANSISRIVTKELSRLGLVDVEVVRYGHNNTRRRNVYTVHEVPPTEWEGSASIQEWYAAHREEMAKAAGHPGPTKNEGSGDTKNEESGHTKNCVDNYTNKQLHETDAAPSARSAGGVRSTTTSGSSRETSGSAAAKKPKLNREQMAAVRAVEAALPPALLGKLAGGRIPSQNRRAVLAALESRTVNQLAARIARRWPRFEAEFADGEIRNLYALTTGLIAPTPYCPDLSCEDGVMVDTGADCRACVERRTERRAAYNRGDDPRQSTSTAPPRPECIDCGKPFPGTVPADGTCRACREMPAAVSAALLAQWAAEDAEQQQDEPPETGDDWLRATRAAEEVSHA